jgi:hypothetical protein
LLLFRIDGTGSVQDTLRLVQARYGRALAGQANFFYGFGQAQPPAPHAGAAAQYVVPKLHLLEAHRITNGDDVLVAVIDSKIDASHPDLAGVIADEYDALGTPGPAHRRAVYRHGRARSCHTFQRHPLQSNNATARVQPPEPAFTLCGKQATVKPNGGSCSRLHSFSM